MPSTSFLRLANERGLKVKLKHRRKSWLMWVCAFFLTISDKLKITKIGNFMDGYITTVGHTIYHGAEWSMDMEPNRVVVHECCHIALAENDFWYPIKYLCSKFWRAYYETTCTQAEMLCFEECRGDNFIRNRASFFVGYGLDNGHLMRMLITRSDEIADDYAQPAADTVFRIFKEWKDSENN